jgi:hypothetical protein
VLGRTTRTDVRLCGSKRREISASKRRQPERAKDAIERGDRHKAWGRDLDADWAAIGGQVDNQTGHGASCPCTAVARASRQVEVGSQRAPLPKGDLEYEPLVLLMVPVDAQ